MDSGFDTSYAHSIDGKPERDWELLKNHLSRVAEQAAAFADKFGSGSLGRTAGWLHDWGKLDPAFQRRLHGDSRPCDHAAQGAALAMQNHPKHIGRILAAVVAGHHAGLSDGVALNGTNPSRTLEDRIREAESRVSALKIRAGRDKIDVQSDAQLPPMRPTTGSYGFGIGFLIRFLFSALVDADRLATEAFYNEAESRPSVRRFEWAELSDLKGALDKYLDGFVGKTGELNVRRAKIFQAVRDQSDLDKGVFSLAVPTGGGKTLASLAFALDHAVQHNLDRVIVVIPFTSVVEQTAAVYRQALKPHDGSVLEHHSAFDEEVSIRTEGREITESLRLATQNWDAPLVITTAVQFFESLFSNRPAKCRKLHNIANSVIVLDEAQIMPLDLLCPAVRALDELACNYGCSIVLSTATQPPLETLGLRNVRHLIADASRLAADMQRVTVGHAGRWSDEDLASQIAAADRVLAIVNTRAHARALFRAVRDLPGARHLSTCMCAAHRLQVLEEIRDDLAHERPCRVVSTSLIEAGVDVDFGLVLRAEAGLDQIVQAAGRCNREFKHPLENSQVIVFEPDDEHKLKVLRINAEVAHDIFAEVAAGRLRDVLGPEAMTRYFSELYFRKGNGRNGSQTALDAKDILELMETRVGDCWFPFETVAARFRMIEDTMVPLIVNWRGEADDALQQLVHAPFPGTAARGLQRYVVNVPIKARAELMKRGAASMIRKEKFGDQFVQLDDMALYREDSGLDWTDPTFMTAETLLI